METRHCSLIPSLFYFFLFYFFSFSTSATFFTSAGRGTLEKQAQHLFDPTAGDLIGIRQRYRVLWATLRVICFGEASRVGKWRLVIYLRCAGEAKNGRGLGVVNRINQNANLHLSMHFYSFKLTMNIYCFTLFLLYMSLDKIKVFLVPNIMLLS